MHGKLKLIRIFKNILILNCKLQLNKAARDQDKMNFPRGVDQTMSKFSSNKPLTSSWKCLSHRGRSSLSKFDIFLIKSGFFSPVKLQLFSSAAELWMFPPVGSNFRMFHSIMRNIFTLTRQNTSSKKCASTSKREVSPAPNQPKGRKTEKKPKQ